MFSGVGQFGHAGAAGVAGALTQWAPPHIGATNPSVYADFAAGNYWAAGAVQSSFSAFMSAAGGTYTNSTGKFVTNASGNLQQLAANTVPFNYRWNGSAFAAAGVLLEGASTNRQPFSSFSSNTSAFTTNGLTVAADTAFAPDGTLTATSFTLTAASVQRFIFYSDGVGVPAAACTWSFYAKAFGPTNYQIQADLLNEFSITANFDVVNGMVTGTVGCSASIIPLADGWYRCSLTATPAAASSPNEVLYGWDGSTRNITGDGVSGWYVWGLQIENLPFASSYIPTTAVAVTREADNLTLAPAGGFSITAETFFYEIADYPNPSATAYLGQLSDAPGNNEINVFLGPSNGFGQVLSAGAGPNVQTTNAPNLGGVNKLGISASVAAGATLVLNAGPAANIAAAMPVTLPFCFVGYINDPVTSFGGNTSAIGAWPVAATAVQLQALTT